MTFLVPPPIRCVRGGWSAFDTPIGRCALVWHGAAIIGVALPESTEERLRARISSRFPDAIEADPPAPAAGAIQGIVGLLSGEKADLSGIEIELDDISVFDREVYEATRRIPRGEVRTYGHIALELGQPGAAQAVGAALGRNPVPIIVPCHRVLAADGRSGGFSAPGGVATKFRILEIEGAKRAGEPELFESLPLRVKPG